MINTWYKCTQLVRPVALWTYGWKIVGMSEGSERVPNKKVF